MAENAQPENKFRVTTAPTETEGKSITDCWESEWMPWEEAQLLFLRQCTELTGFSPGAITRPVPWLQCKSKEWTVTIEQMTF